MLFIDYSSAFNTIVPSKLIIKLETLGLNPALCDWVLDFLMGRPQVVKVGKHLHFSDTQHGTHKDVCSAPSCTPCIPITVWPRTPPSQSSSLQTTEL